MGIDLIGPLPETKKGNKYIVTLLEYLDSHSIQKKNYVLFQRILPSTPHSRLLTKNFSVCVVCLSAMTNAWCSVQRVRAGITSSVWDLNQRTKSLKAGSVIAALVNKSFNFNY